VAISSLGLLGSAQVQSSGTTVTITLSAGAPIGSLVVVRVASDNLSETTPTFTAADSKSNTWTQRAFQGRNATAAQGVVGAIITSHLTTALAAADTITVTLSGSVVAKAAYAEAFSGVGVFKFNSTFSSSSFGNVSASFFSGVHVAGDLLLGAAGFETRTAIPGDIDTFQGTWSTQQSFASTSSGTDTDAVTIVGQHKIVTGTGTQQYNFTGPSTDAVGIGAIFGQIYYGSGAITLDGASVLGSNAGLTPDADDWWPVAGGIAGFGVVGAGRLDELQTIDGSGAITLDTVASAGDGSPVVTASGTPTLDGAAVAGTGSPVLTASGAIDLGGATVAGAGTLTVTASGAVTLDGAAVAGAGTLTLTGAGAVDLDSVGAAGDGTLTVTGAGAIDLDGVTIAGAGLPVLATLASGAIDLDGVTIAGAGTLVVNASGALALDDAEVAAAGSPVVSGASAVDLDSVTVAGAGLLPGVDGSGAVDLDSVTVAGTGAPVVTASGAVVLGDAVVAGAGSPVVTVAGAVLLDSVAVAGAGALVVTGAGAVDLDSVAVAATGTMVATAAGAVQLGDVLFAGAARPGPDLAVPSYLLLAKAPPDLILLSIRWPD
jgi:uncharacterized protein YdeI (BOF family)